MEGKRKTNGKRNKSAGHGWELEIINTLHEKGLYPPESVVSCRSNSRRLDNAGIDLMHLDESTHGMMRDSIQAKTATVCPPFPKLLAAIAKALRPGGVVFWRQTSASATGRQMERGRFAMTNMDRYLQLMACEAFVNWVKDAAYYNGPPQIDSVFGGAIRDELKRLDL